MKTNNEEFQWICNVEWRTGLGLPSHLQGKIELRGCEYPRLKSLWCCDRSVMPGFWEWYENNVKSFDRHLTWKDFQ